MNKDSIIDFPKEFLTKDYNSRIKQATLEITENHQVFSQVFSGFSTFGKRQFLATSSEGAYIGGMEYFCSYLENGCFA